MRIERWGKWKREGGRYLHSQLCLLQNIIIMLTSLRRATRPFCKVVALLISNSVSSTALFNSSRICRLILAPCRYTSTLLCSVLGGARRTEGGWETAEPSEPMSRNPFRLINRNTVCAAVVPLSRVAYLWPSVVRWKSSAQRGRETQ